MYVLAGGVWFFFLSGGAASTTVRLHIKYETKQVPGPCPGRRPPSCAQNAVSSAVRMGRRSWYGRSRVLWRNGVRRTHECRRYSSIVHDRRGARATVVRAASRVRNRTRHRLRVWLVAAASKPVGSRQSYGCSWSRCGAGTGRLPADGTMFGTKPETNERTKVLL